MAEQKNVKPEELLVPLDPNGSSETAFLCVNGKICWSNAGNPLRSPRLAEVYRNAQMQQKAALQVQRAAMSHPSAVR